MKKAIITGVTGQDGVYLAEFLLSKGYEVYGIKIRSSLFNTQRIDHSHPTTLKQRFRSKGKSLLRVSYLHQGAISLDLQKKFLPKLKRKLTKLICLYFQILTMGVCHNQWSNRLSHF